VVEVLRLLEVVVQDVMTTEVEEEGWEPQQFSAVMAEVLTVYLALVEVVERVLDLGVVAELLKVPYFQ
jgi:hypothetical protein